VLKVPILLFLKAYNPTAVFCAPVELYCRVFKPTLVLLDTLPPPIPTLTVLKVESKVVVKDPEIFVEPVTVKLPVGITTVP
jgi:hypothetical protein